MSQLISKDLREWILAQAKAASPVEAVLKSMVHAGWKEDVAIEALQSTLTDHWADLTIEGKKFLYVWMPMPG